MMVLNYRTNGVRDYFQKFFSIIGPFTPMNRREHEFLAYLIETRYLRNIESLNYKAILTSPDRAKIAKEMGISLANIGVVIASLKRKSIIVDGIIKKEYGIAYEKSGGVVFSLKHTDE